MTLSDRRLMLHVTAHRCRARRSQDIVNDCRKSLRRARRKMIDLVNARRAGASSCVPRFAQWQAACTVERFWTKAGSLMCGWSEGRASGRVNGQAGEWGRVGRSAADGQVVGFAVLPSPRDTHPGGEIRRKKIEGRRQIGRPLRPNCTRSSEETVKGEGTGRRRVKT